MNKLENFQKKITGFEFIKSYPMLSRLPISSKQKEIIELILSYQHNNRNFYMNYSAIAEILDIKNSDVVKVNISTLKKLKLISTINTKNYNGKNGGSSTSITVNEDYILELISNTLIDTPNIVSNDTLEESEVVLPEIIKEVVTIEEITIQPIKENKVINSKKEEFRIKYNNTFKNQEGKMLPVQFNTLTNNVFYGMTQLSIADRMLPKDDFELVWDKIQEYKKLIKK